VGAWHADVLARNGDIDTAGAELGELDLDELVALERTSYWLPTLAMLADAAHLARRPAVGDLIGTLVESLVGLTIVDLAPLYRGTVSHVAGLADATCGRVERARDLLADALASHERHGSAWMAVRSQTALAALG
jgi:hypothetical protein